MDRISEAVTDPDVARHFVYGKRGLEYMSPVRFTGATSYHWYYPTDEVHRHPVGYRCSFEDRITEGLLDRLARFFR